MDERRIALYVNGRRRVYEGSGDKPLLWVLRDDFGLTGTKYGCGAGLCGACTVHVGGEAVRACTLAVAEVGQRTVRTIEGLEKAGRLHTVQQAWIEQDVAQCGYCQAGQIMAAVALLERNPRPTRADIDAITNLCRCGTYPRVRRAIAEAAARMEGRS